MTNMIPIRFAAFFMTSALIAISLVTANLTFAAEITFQFVNDTDRALNLKLFSRGESLQIWPGRSKAYSLRPDSAVQQLKIRCTEGESICWGAWMTMQSVSGQITGSARSTSTFKTHVGVGERGTRDCPSCCQVCTDGATGPIVKLGNSIALGPDVR
ncbi:MAG: hypothetical protein ING75_13195 [Rhodocyclaceae bacterium]|nr:hypothetical protein [Rhodocyclaceae bacterium]